MPSSTRLNLLFAAAAALLLAGCASTPPAPPKTPEQAVAERAGLRWQAMIEGRWEDAYALLTPGYREANTIQGFQSNFLGSPVKWKSAQVGKVICDSAERCKADVRVEFELDGGMPGVPQVVSFQHVDETWLQVGGGWHHLPRR